MSTKLEIQDEVISTLADVFGFEKQSLASGTRLVEDLDLDSIDAIEMAVKIEKRLGFAFSGPDLRTVRTVQDIVDLIHSRQYAHANAAADGSTARRE